MIHPMSSEDRSAVMMTSPTASASVSNLPSEEKKDRPLLVNVVEDFKNLNALAQEVSVPANIRDVWVASYKRLDVNSDEKLNATQVYAAFCMNHPPGAPTVDWFVLEEIFDDLDVERLRTCNLAMFDQVMHAVYNETMANRREQKEFFIVTFLALVFWPLVMPLAWPTRTTRGAVFVRFIMRKLLVWAGLPRTLRQKLTTERFWFVIQFFSANIAYTLIVGNFIAAAYFINLPYTMALSGLEVVVPLYSMAVCFFMLAWIFTLSDTDAQETIQKELDDASLGASPVVCTPLGNAPAPTASSAVSPKGAHTIVKNAEDVLSLMLEATQEEIAMTKRMLYVHNSAAIAAGGVMAFLPFACRLYLHYSFFAQCPTFSGVDTSGCTRYNVAFIVISIVAAFNTWWATTFFLRIMIFSNVHMEERQQWYSRMRGLLEKDKAIKRRVPFLTMDFPQNIVAFHKIRLFLVNFKETDLKRIQTVLVCMLVLLASLFALVFYQRFKGFSSDINAADVYVSTGYMIWILTCYFVYPTLIRGVKMNEDQDGIPGFFSNEKFRLCVRAEVKAESMSEADCHRYTAAAELADKYQTYLTEHPSTFCVLGIAVNMALVYSLATTAFGAFWAWISPYLTG